MKIVRVGAFLVFNGLLFAVVAPMTARADLGAKAVASPSASGGALVVSGASKVEASAPTAAASGANAATTNNNNATMSCPADMVEVEGDYCPTLKQECVKWMDKKDVFPRRCAEFAPGSGKCEGKTVKKHFCIDKYEYPNKRGEKPAVMKSWRDAQDACKAQGKRLCGDSEWTLACEGRERLPYPYGNKRDAAACNIDKPHPDVNERALGSADARVRNAEVDRLWQGETSGARPQCVSPFGVFDMTGNVDEWVVNESGHPYKSGSKGGYWGPVRDRCRPMTTAHGEEFSFYQLGFRCCGDTH
jgi:formylglycine-generating enzyme